LKEGKKDDHETIHLDPELGPTGGQTAEIHSDGTHLSGTIRNPYDKGYLTLTRKPNAEATITEETMKKALLIVHNIPGSPNKRQGDMMAISSVQRALKKELGSIADQIEIRRS